MTEYVGVGVQTPQDLSVGDTGKVPGRFSKKLSISWELQEIIEGPVYQHPGDIILHRTCSLDSAGNKRKPNGHISVVVANLWLRSVQDVILRELNVEDIIGGPSPAEYFVRSRGYSTAAAGETFKLWTNKSFLLIVDGYVFRIFGGTFHKMMFCLNWTRISPAARDAAKAYETYLFITGLREKYCRRKACPCSGGYKRVWTEVELRFGSGHKIESLDGFIK